MSGDAAAASAERRDAVRITALLFAQYRSDAGTDALELELPAGATVRTAARAVEAALDGTVTLRGAMAAVNERYGRPDSVLTDGDRVAFLPPVSGG